MTKISKSILSVLSVLFVLMSCSDKGKKMEAADLVSWTENGSHGLRKNIESGDWTYTVQLRPADYIISQESKGSIDREAYKSRKKQLDSTVWFSFFFKNHKQQMEPLRIGISDVGAYNQRLDYFLNGAQKDFVLVCGADTIPAMSYVFEPNYNLMSAQSMLVGFRLNEKDYNSDLDILFLDRVFNNGIIKGHFRQSDIENTPILNVH